MSQSRILLTRIKKVSLFDYSSISLRLAEFINSRSLEACFIAYCRHYLLVLLRPPTTTKEEEKLI